jgi:hypothetical protein
MLMTSASIERRVWTAGKSGYANGAVVTRVETNCRAQENKTSLQREVRVRYRE